MKLESLQQKKQEIEKQAQAFSKECKHNSFDEGFQKGVETAFDTFVNLIDQYKHYKNDVKLLMDEQAHLWKEWVQYYEKQPDIPQSEYLVRYNAWLFDYLFYQKFHKSMTGNSLFSL